MFAKLASKVYKAIRFSQPVQSLVPLTPLERLGQLVGEQKASILKEGVEQHCAGSATAMGDCARKLDALGGICGCDDAPLLALLLTKTVAIAAKRLTVEGGIPPELEPLLKAVRLVLPKEHILPPEASHPLRIGIPK